jgi:hypothetical protein
MTGMTSGFHEKADVMKVMTSDFHGKEHVMKLMTPLDCHLGTMG